MAVSPGIKSPGMFATRTDLSGTPATPRVRLGRLAPCVKIFKIILSVVFVYYKLQYFIFKSNRYNILHYVNIHTCCPPTVHHKRCRQRVVRDVRTRQVAQPHTNPTLRSFVAHTIRVVNASFLKFIYGKARMFWLLPPPHAVQLKRHVHNPFSFFLGSIRRYISTPVPRAGGAAGSGSKMLSQSFTFGAGSGTGTPLDFIRGFDGGVSGGTSLGSNDSLMVRRHRRDTFPVKVFLVLTI